MAQVTISGSIKVVGKTQQVSDKFTKRELIVTEPSGQRPQHIPIEFTQDRTSLLDSYKPGDEVSVTCYVNGREWTGKDGVTKYFLSLSGNRIERAGAAAPATSGGGGYQAAPPPTMADMPASSSASDEDDLPF
jgi:single-stranded DNA-binding protein